MTRARWIAPTLWALLMELLTSWPNPPSFGAPNGFDKFAHFGLYAVFAFLVARAVEPGRPSLRASVVVFAAICIWGAVDEWHQKFIDGRGASVADWTADVAGALGGLAFRWTRPRRLTAGTA